MRSGTLRPPAADSSRPMRAVLIMWFNRFMTCAFKIITLIGKYQSPEVAEAVLRLANYLRDQGLAVLIEQERGEFHRAHLRLRRRQLRGDRAGRPGRGARR